MRKNTLPDSSYGAGGYLSLYLFFVVIAKRVLSTENIISPVERQKKTYTIPMAYDYFYSELENMLYYVFGITDSAAQIGVTASQEMTMLR